MPRGNSWTLSSLEVFLVKTTPSNETRMLYSQALPSFSLKNLVPSNWTSGMMHLVLYYSSYKWPISLFFSAGFMSLFSCCLVLQFLYLLFFLFSHVIFPLFAGPKRGNFYGRLFKSLEQSLLGSKLLFDICSLKPVVCGIIFFSDTSSLFIGSVISCGICIIWYFSEMQLIHVILLPSCSSPS